MASGNGGDGDGDNGSGGDSDAGRCDGGVWCEKARVCVVDNACTWATRGENRALLGSLKSLEEGERGQQ